MSDHTMPRIPKPPAPSEGSSGRVQFDERGQAIWEWSVRTGLFDRNASTQRVKKLTESPLSLEKSESAQANAVPQTPNNPYERVSAKVETTENLDPFRRKSTPADADLGWTLDDGKPKPGAAELSRKASGPSFNPYDRPLPRKR
jgi:hypothetical protein